MQKNMILPWDNVNSLKKTPLNPIQLKKLSSLTFLYNSIILTLFSEAVAQRCSVKKVFLEISQKSQANTCFRVSFLTKLQTST